jgi:hypothetical protein
LKPQNSKEKCDEVNYICWLKKKNELVGSHNHFVHWLGAGVSRSVFYSGIGSIRSDRIPDNDGWGSDSVF